jgi:hypothetical protein
VESKTQAPAAAKVVRVAEPRTPRRKATSTKAKPGRRRRYRSRLHHRDGGTMIAFLH